MPLSLKVLNTASTTNDECNAFSVAKAKLRQTQGSPLRGQPWATMFNAFGEQNFTKSAPADRQNELLLRRGGFRPFKRLHILEPHACWYYRAVTRSSSGVLTAPASPN
jgi:hypothetical protein